MEKSCRKFAPKASPRPLFNFGKYPKTNFACKKFFWNKHFEKELWKSHKKLTLSFPLNTVVLFSGQNYKKLKGPGTSDQLLLRLQKKFRNIPLLVMYYGFSSNV